MDKEAFLKERNYRLFRQMNLIYKSKPDEGIEWWEYSGGRVKILITFREPFLMITSDIQPMNLTLRDPSTHNIESWIKVAENYLLLASKIIAPAGVQGVYSPELAYCVDAIMLLKDAFED